MKTLAHHIEHIKTKPHATRRQIALATAFGCTSFIALIWVVTVVSTGTFAIQGSSFAESTGQGTSGVVAAQNKNNSDLLGAASAAFGIDNTPAHIEVVSSATSSTLSKKQKQAEQTVIPF